MKRLDTLRSILAILCLRWAMWLAPAAEKEHFAEGVIRTLIRLKMAQEPQASYRPVRFYRICQELGLDPHKVVHQENGEIFAILLAFEDGQMDEVQVMTALRNLSILNGGKWRA